MTSGMTQEHNIERQIEKQMGCMAGFLQLFDRQHILTGKKLYSPKRLTPPNVANGGSGSETSATASPDVSRELTQPKTPQRPKSPAAELGSPAPAPAPKSPLPLPIFDFNKKGTAKTSPWNLRETPRLSLDSRATYDPAKGSFHRKEIRADRQILAEDARDESDNGDDKQRPRSSTSVIARLMGLEPVSQPDCEPVKPAELRRSASESRVTRDLFHYRFMEANNHHCDMPTNVVKDSSNAAFINKNSTKYEVRKSKVMNKGGNASSAIWRFPQQRRSWFEAAEGFPEAAPKQTVSIYGEIDKRLKKMSGNIDEISSRDFETLKQILEVWQLKGLLHSKRQSLEKSNQLKNIVFDRSFSYDDESPIVVMRPPRSQTHHRIRENSPNFSRGGGARRILNLGREAPATRSPLRGTGFGENTANVRRSNSIVKQKPLRVETQRRVNESTENRRTVISPNYSPSAVNQRRIGSDPTVTNRSPRHKKPTAGIYQKEKFTTVVATEDESSSISGSTVSSSSQTDTERSKMEEYKEGKSLLERCDKLLHSIAEMTATEQQSSPVSVLDSSFYDTTSPSPIMKRSIDLKENGGELEEEAWSRAILLNQPKLLYDAPENFELVYISEILRASHSLPEDSDIFALLEKQQYLKGKDTSKVSRLERKLIFDTITELLDRNRQLPPWKDSIGVKSSLQNIWLEFQIIRGRDNADDLVEIICEVLKKDLAGDAVNGWGEYPVELSEMVLDIERMIFRDLIGETILDLAAFACHSSSTVLALSRRKLVF